MTLLHGDSLQILKDINDESIDLLLTDPPYGIEFMGKDWDKALPSIDIWKECYRVLKTGKLAFVMCSPRQDVLSRMIISLEDAGFRTNYTSIYWTYASGFPKAANVSKLLDKRAEQNTEYLEERKKLQCYMSDQLHKKYKHHEILANELNVNESMIRHWTGKAGDQNSLPTLEYYKLLKQKLDLDSRYDDLIKLRPSEWIEAEREIIGKSNNGVGKISNSGIYMINDSESKMRRDFDLTKPATEEAKKMEGAYVGFQPKPAVEVILVVSKGKTLTWLDDCRIPYQSEEDLETAKFGGKAFSNLGSNEGWKRQAHDDYGISPPNEKGRFPANLCVQDSILDTMDNNYSRYFSLDAWDKSKALNRENNNQKPLKENISVTDVETSLQTTKAIEKENNKCINSVQRNAQQYSDLENLNQNAKSVGNKQDYTEIDTVQNTVPIKQDLGTYQEILSILEKELTMLIMQKEQTQIHQNNVQSVNQQIENSKDIIQICLNQLRLYGCVDPAIIEQTQQDLNHVLHLEKLPESVRNIFPFMAIAKASKSEKGEFNRHATVKPVKLMSYLITMGSRENDLILDPFCGSGTTLIAADNLARKYIGIEINKEYLEIAKYRLLPHIQQTKLLISKF